MKRTCLLVILSFSLHWLMASSLAPEVFFEKSNKEVKLMWTVDELSPDLSGFIVQRCTNGSEWKTVQTLDFGMSLQNMNYETMPAERKKEYEQTYSRLTSRREFLKSDQIQGFIAENPDDAEMLLWLISADFEMSVLSGFAFIDEFNVSSGECKYKVTPLLSGKPETDHSSNEISVKHADELKTTYTFKTELINDDDQEKLMVEMDKNTFKTYNILYFKAYVLNDSGNEVLTTNARSLPVEKDEVFRVKISLDKLDLSETQTLFVSPVTLFGTPCDAMKLTYTP